MSTLPRPPGTSGIPLLGEALSFAGDPFTFMRSRVETHGPVVRSRLLGKDLAILAGPEAAEAFLSEDNVRRAGGLPPHAAGLFGTGAVNQVDGETHRRRKAHLMRAVDPAALAHYLPGTRQRLRARVSRWRAAGEVRLQHEAPLANIELNLWNFASIEADDDSFRRFVHGYGDFAKALVGLPLALPGTPLARARRFTTEMVDRFATVAEQRRNEGNGDAASRLAASEVDGERLEIHDIAQELQHLVFAAAGMWSWMCLGVQVLAQDAALANRLRAVATDLPDAPTARAYAEAPGLDDFVREIKRVGMVIPITAIGIARRDFAVAGHTVPAGWLVTWATSASHLVPGVAPYEEPGRFDPTRFGRGEGAAPNSFAPQGPGEPLTSHRCAGVEYSSLVLQAFFVELLRSGPFALPPQDLSLNTAAMPARWRDGLRVTFAS